MSSFLMRDLLRLHGKEELLRNTQLTQAVAEELRAMGYTLRIVRFNGRKYPVWSNEFKTDFDIHSDKEKWRSMAREIVKRLPIGKIQLGSGRWLE